MINVNEDTINIDGNFVDVLADFVMIVTALKRVLSKNGISDETIRIQLTNAFILGLSREDNKSN